MPTLEERVQALEDKEGVLRTLHAYAHCMDVGRDPDAWLDLFTEDGVWKASAITKTAGIGGDYNKGHKELSDWYMRAGRGKDEYWTDPSKRATQHNIAVVDIRVDGDVATAESHMIVTQEGKPGEGPRIWAIGTYKDVLVRCPDGHWRFKVRNLERTGAQPEGQVRRVTTFRPEEDAARRAAGL